VRWITTLLDRTLAQPHEPATSQHREGARQCALADVPLAGWARVLDVSGLAATQGEQLHGYGILPGCVLRIIQRTPVTVVQIGHTELAIETELARAIRVNALV
jgi:Fe2+ transport system protein FeoA